MDTEKIQNLIKQAMDERETKNAYGVSKVSYHTHNGTDSPALPNSNVTITGRSGGSAITTMATATTTKIPFNVNTFANGITWDSTNNRFVVITAGYYSIIAQIEWYNNNAGGGQYYTIIYLNGAQNSYSTFQAGTINFLESGSFSDVLNLKAGDYIEVFGTQGSGAVAGIYNDTNQTFLSITKV